MRMLKKYFFHVALCLLLLSFNTPATGQDWQKKHSATELRKVPDSVTERMKGDPEFAYANDSSYWQQQQDDEPGKFSRLLNAISKSRLLKLLLWVVLAAGIIFAIYQVMVANNFFLVSRKKRGTSTAHGGDEDLTPENLDERILEETRNKNYRQAVRYMYLKTLKLLSEYNVITLHAKSTNQDYIRQMYNHSGLVKFRQLTRIYEYVWYGEFNPNESQFDVIRSNFNQFNPRS
ncbi:MAG: DUF4129 domain-containing protein [Chitinophagaceae bacterium]|nr:DUF4129 domain-containing protein [Chitinophagaceae bacterium]